VRVYRHAGVAVAIAIALAGPSACGEDTQPLVGPPPPPGKPASLVGTWVAQRPTDYKLRYVFHRDGTYSHFQGNRQKRKGGTYRYAITARGTSEVRGRTLVLRPRSGTIERHDPDDPSGNFKRPVSKKVQRYGWSVRGVGDQAKLTITIGGSLAISYRRR
jgi:hypothetical protein